MSERPDQGSAWALAGPVAARVAGTYPLVETYHGIRLRETLPGIVHQAADLVAAETRLATPGQPDVIVVSRRQWAERNLATFAHLLEPLESKLLERLEEHDGAPSGIARRIVALETGALLGFLARRVLGQYELVLPSGDQGDVVALVGANVLALERQQQFTPHEFRLWIALHEATHRAQFVGVPWLRQYFLSLVTELVGAAAPSPGRLARLVAEAVEANRQGRPLVDETGILGLIASPEQRQSLDRVQALMSLLEGHGHVVMDRIGHRVLKTQSRMSSILKARRADPKTQAFFRLTGLEMKIRQYEIGERFIQAVEKEAGWGALDRAW
ncbi:MAG TPA: zinc-dependent metalloprotease [Acidimicrobiia bacterium]|nr:zinc-dependent metalloprotease [Acidimicrobiia bacterium]